jgi:UTP--glucose-1-phosphate uridylyltransferase
MECIYIRQPKALGLGHAVLCAQRGGERALCRAAGRRPDGRQAAGAQADGGQFNEWRASILAVQEVPPEHTKRYGIVAGTPVNDRLMDLSHIVEKPARKTRRRTWAWPAATS